MNVTVLVVVVRMIILNYGLVVAEMNGLDLVVRWIILEEDCHLVYAPSANTKSEYLTETIDGGLIEISKLEINEMNSTKSIVSKLVRL